MTILQDILAALNWQIRVNENFRAVSPAALFSKKDSTTTGLTLGYYGGILDGVSYADGTHALTASTTRYVVVARATGVVSSSTGTTNWNDATNYLRMGVAVVGVGTITTWTDWRQAYGGTAGGGGGSVAGADKQIQYNASGSFGAEVGFEYDYSTNTLAVPNATFSGLALTAASATGGAGFRLPHGTAPTSPTNGDLWTTTAGLYACINGTTVGPYGAGGGMSNPLTTTGDIIYSSSGATAARLGIGSANQVLTVAGGVPTWQNAASGFANPMTTAGDLILGGTSGVPTRLPIGSVDGLLLTAIGGAVVWRAPQMLQNSQSAAYTLVAADAGKHLLHPSADATPRAFTIPSSASVAFPVGTAVTFVNQNGAGALTIAITSDTMRLAGPGTTGSRTLAANGMATALKIAATEWIISGNGLT